MYDKEAYSDHPILIRRMPCRVARLLQPCLVGKVRHGFVRVYTGILNTWIGNEADIRLNYGIPNFHPCCA